jgi:hypothetical protein
MKHAVSTHLTEDDMDSIDVHDLPEEQAELLAAFVAFLRQRQREAGQEAEAQERDWATGASTSFATDWENDEDAIYDNWREHYHVPER